MKSKSLRRHHRFRVIRRKLHIIEHNCFNITYIGYLAKNKIHCSCKYCRCRDWLYSREYYWRRERRKDVNNEI